MTTKWLSRQGDPLQGYLYVANQQKKYIDPILHWDKYGNEIYKVVNISA